MEFILVTSVPMSLIMTYVMIQHDLTTGDGVSEMIGFSVRWAVPLIYIVTAASAVNILFPNTLQNGGLEIESILA